MQQAKSKRNEYFTYYSYKLIFCFFYLLYIRGIYMRIKSLAPLCPRGIGKIKKRSFLVCFRQINVLEKSNYHFSVKPGTLKNLNNSTFSIYVIRFFLLIKINLKFQKIINYKLFFDTHLFHLDTID